MPNKNQTSLLKNKVAKEIKLQEVIFINFNNYIGEFKYNDKQKPSVPLNTEKPLMNL